MIKFNNIFKALLLVALLSSCNKYLDFVPDNVARLENAFTMRKEAMKYLATCYSYMPQDASPSGNVAFTAGDELALIWPFIDNSMQADAYRIARGEQNIGDPMANYWNGTRGGRNMWAALRDCNIFLENIVKVPDMTEEERNRWIGEAKFLKAYYHFVLLRLYGPIPLIKTNLPIDADQSQVKIYRDPVDSCFNYIVQLIDEAKGDLPPIITNETEELGRITQLIALSFKAKVLVFAASPLFNGNADYNAYVDNRGTKLINTTKDDTKWEKAVVACQEAVDACTQAGLTLYKFVPTATQATLSPQTQAQLGIRNAVVEKWNTEIIWANTNSNGSGIQSFCYPRGLDPANTSTAPRGQMSPPLKIVENFYTKNGLPISEDKTWDYANRYQLRTAVNAERFNIEEGYQTAYLNFDREDRFYADLGFDGGKWYGVGKYDDKDIFTLKMKRGQSAAQQVQFSYSTTGYFVKKLLHYTTTITTTATSIKDYPWPEMRLADLYLLYAEALNEAGRSADALIWINKVRDRANIPTVENAWTNFAKNPAGYTTKDGLRKIIHQERSIELAFEGHRYWDLLRWKEATDVLNQPIAGWDISQSAADAYYRVRVIFNQAFGQKNYFQPLRESNITINRNLVQSPGW